MRLAAILLLALATPLWGQDSDDLAGRIEELASPDSSTREAAAAALLDVGLEGREALLAARSHPDLEVRGRIEWILARGLLGALLEGRTGDLLANWARWSDRIGVAYAGKFPRLDEGRVSTRMPGWSRHRARIEYSTVPEEIGRSANRLEALRKGPPAGSLVLNLDLDPGDAVKRHVAVFAEPGLAPVLSHCDGRTALRDVPGGPGALHDLLLLARFGALVWDDAARPGHDGRELCATLADFVVPDGSGGRIRWIVDFTWYGE